MAEKSSKAKNTDKPNKNIIAGICAAAVAVVVVAIIAVVIVNGGGISDSYFKSDDTKYVFTMETDTSTLEGDEASYAPIKTHVVYTYKDDTITGMKTYAEYADNSTAQKAFDLMKEADADSVKNAEVNGKYIVLTGDESSYEGMTASDVKSYIDFMESLKNMNLDNASESDTTESIEESTEEITE